MSREIEQPSLDEYPVNTANGKIEKLAGYTIYKIDREGGYWAGIVAIKSHFYDPPRNQVIRYRWQFRQPKVLNSDGKFVPQGAYKWMLDQKYTINKDRIWKQERDAIDEFVGRYLE